MPECIDEEQARARFDTGSMLASGGEYGCHVLVFDAGEPDIQSREYWMCDNHFRALWDQFAPNTDIGTIIIDGDLELVHEASISDRLMCLIVTGSLTAAAFHVFATEVSVYGDCDIQSLTDRDEYLRVHGTRSVASAD